MAASDAGMVTASGEVIPGGEQLIEVGSARVAVSRLWHDFGLTKPFSVVQAQFRLENVSAAPVRIERVATSCGCTTVGGGKAGSILPGMSIAVPVTVSTGSRRTLHEVVWVSLRGDEGHGHVALHLFATQVPPMEVVPDRVSLGLVARSQAAAASIRLTESAADRFEVLAVESGDLPLTWRIERKQGADLATYLVHLSVEASGLPAGEHSGTICIRTTSAFRPVVEVPVRFSVAQEVKPRPAIIDFGAGDADHRVAPAVVTLEHRTGQPLNVRVLDVPAGFRVALQESGSRAQLTVALENGLTASSTGVIRTLASWQGASETVEIPC
jgi:hypothetical protein